MMKDLDRCRAKRKQAHPSRMNLLLLLLHSNDVIECYRRFVVASYNCRVHFDPSPLSLNSTMATGQKRSSGCFDSIKLGQCVSLYLSLMVVDERYHSWTISQRMMP